MTNTSHKDEYVVVIDLAILLTLLLSMFVAFVLMINTFSMTFGLNLAEVLDMQEYLFCRHPN